METNLSKDADKSICLIYKEYLRRRKSGSDKKSARDFFYREQWPDDFTEKRRTFGLFGHSPRTAKRRIYTSNDGRRVLP